MNWVLTDDPGVIRWVDYIRVASSALAIFTIALYLRMAWLRWCRHKAGEQVRRWPVLGTASLTLLLLVVASLALQRRGQPLTWRGPVTWLAESLATVEALRSMRLTVRPPWRRHHPYHDARH